MASAVATVSITDERYTWVAGNKYTVIANIAVSPSPATYVTGGIPCSFLVPLVKASRTPIWVVVEGLSGFTYVYVPGVDASSGLLKILSQATTIYNPQIELANGASIPAAVSNDTITVEAIFNGQN